MSKFPKFLLFLAIGLVMVALVYAGFRYVKNNLKITRGSATNLEKPDWIKTAKEAQKVMATVAPTPKPDFTADGSLHLKDKGEETENWTFLYKEPDKLAVIAYLTFNFRSQCDLGRGEQICNTEKLENGLKVKIEGNKNGSNLTVLKLKLLE